MSINFCLSPLKVAKKRILLALIQEKMGHAMWQKFWVHALGKTSELSNHTHTVAKGINREQNAIVGTA